MGTTLPMCLFALLALFSIPADGHVALTYPPARRYDLDFLDNGRTPAPCGMPKGTIKTTLIKGSTINVTWHLAYPHQGGFYLELLNPTEQHQMFLTGSGQFIANDTTAQHFELKLPNDLECRDCSIRLVRQASEWGGNYRFWSCADVDILPRLEVKRTCNGNGRFFSNRCLCNKRFFGDDCQYENECEVDEDCSSRFGKCVNVEATTYPKKQCFCTRGYYGVKCSKASLIKTETQVNLGVYTKKALSDALTLYWRILHQEGELEVVLVNKGLSYAAIGWRPSDATTSCRNFPPLNGPPPPTRFESKEPLTRSGGASGHMVEGKPEPEPEPHAEGKPEPEPEPKPEGEPEPKPEGEPEPKPEGEPEPEPTPKPKGEPEPEPDKRVTLAFPDSFAFQPLPPAERAKPDRKIESLIKEDELPLSLADRLAKYVNKRSKRNLQDSDIRPYASPLLKAARPATIIPTPVPTNQGKPEPEPEPKPNGEPEPEPKPKGEPEPEPNPKGEPEPKPEGEPEPKPEPNAKTQPKSEPKPVGEPEPEPKPEGEPEPEPKPEGEPEPKPEGEPEPKPEGEPEPEPKPEGEPEPTAKTASTSMFGGGVNLYAPRDQGLHPMDCTDIVIGMARGSFYRAFDYYTRDRSTPRVDEFWGGEDSLTAVFGWEKDGETTILFRKNLTAFHPTDHDIKNNLMHVIWARGQEENMYIHAPKSGLEVGTPSIPNFYKPDEVKYHGKGDQRGVTTINFYDSESNLAQAGRGEKINWCGGQWKYPHSCSETENNCEYFARWEFIEETDEIQFVVSSNHTNLWTGIGFSDDGYMRNTDVVLGWMTPAGKYFMYDGWLRSYTPPVVDGQQGISNMSATQQNGITTIYFTRKRQSNDEEDLSFTDSKCLYLVFPVKGGNVNFVNKRVSKHHLTPTISSQRICIRSCAKFGGADGEPIVFTTTPKPPELVYNIQFKITNAGENREIPNPGTLEYSSLVNRILSSTEGVFQKIPGFVVADVANLDGSQTRTVKVTARVTLNKEMYEEKQGPTNTDKEKSDATVRVRNLLNESVKSGRIGPFSVDPSYLRVDYLQAREVSGVLSEEKVSEKDESSQVLAFMANNKFWFIGASIGALVLLAFVQGVITSCRKKGNASPPVSTKERLITNSRWKDYSRGATNYAYETYEAEGEPDARAMPSLQRESGSPYKNGGRAIGGGSSNGHLNGGFPSPKEINGGYDHTRSLQRPRNVHSSVISDPRTTYSLPRGSSASSSPPPYSTTMQDLTPDFYYLPSQRKYSGEVVRVYVDYNEPI